MGIARIFFLSFIPLFSFGQNIPECQKHDNINVIYIDLYGAYQKRDNYPLSRIATSLEYIPLETNEKDILGGSLNKIFVTSQEIFVFDFGHGAYRFTPDGKFINKIGQVGRGPNECIKPVNMVLDSINKYIILLDHKKLVKYNYIGNFINKYPTDFTSDNIMLIKDDVILLKDMFYQFQKPNERFSFYFFSEEKQKMISKIACEKKDKIPFSICDPIMYNYNNQTYIKDYWSDTIYQVTDPYNLKAYAVIKTGKFDYRVKDDNSVFTGVANPEDTWIIDINYISETDRFIFLLSNKGLFVYDKAQKETICCNMIEENNTPSHFKNDLAPGPNPKVFIYNNTIDNNTQISYNFASEFFDKNSNKIMQGLDKSLKNLKPEDNQVLLKIRFKKR
jgi:hypothetical protein